MAGPEIVLYHYSYSPYARRILWYLALRGIPYKQCLQPGMLPRPDVARLGVNYRRIPIMSIGRDIYLDSRLQLEKLEAMTFPSDIKPPLGSTTAEHRALERLLSLAMTDAGIFRSGVMLLPTDLPMLQDPQYFSDRGDYLGTTLTREGMARARPDAAVAVAAAMEMLETTLLADGRAWILSTAEPSLADVEGVWPFHWLSGIPGALPESISAARYPRVFAWIRRFQEAVSAAKREAPGGKPGVVSGEEAAGVIEGSEYHDDDDDGLGVDEADPVVKALGLRRGDVVVLAPTDTGTAHEDVGRLVRMDGREVVVEVGTERGRSVRLHAPRHGFRVQRKEAARL